MATQGGGLCLMKITLLISSLFVCFPRLCLAITFPVQWDLKAAKGIQSWADSNTYHVGDFFDFSHHGLDGLHVAHSVVETDAAGFQACSTSNSILQDNNGSTVVPLQKAGEHYFICGTHCSEGMKFSVSVLNSNRQAANSPETPNAQPIIDSTSFATSTALPNAMLVGAGALGIPASILFLI